MNKLAGVNRDRKAGDGLEKNLNQPQGLRIALETASMAMA